jgi:4-amino-4-deoxy-L-arabinose transferase-like glycosyltransferase
VLPLAVIVCVFIGSGWRGIDFGYHWDEGDAQILPVQNMVSSGLVFPRASGYPGFSKWLTLMPAVPVGVKAAVVNKGDPRLVQAAMLAKVTGPTFILTARRLYVIFSALAIVWVWAAAIALRRTWWEAAAAAACLGLSWEYAFHSRFVATDCPLVQFTALTVFMLGLYFRERRTLWIYLAAVGAGFATGAKYQGVILLLPVVLASVLTLPVRPLGRQIFRILTLPLIAFAAFLVTTPETIIEPFANWEELLRIARYYEAGHWGYTVTGMGQHLRLVLLFLSVSFLSPFKVVALILFACAVAGAALWIRSDRRVGIVFVCFPIAFLLFFCFKYRAMIIRNYLLVGPFLALFAARGLTELGGLLPRRWLRFSLAGAATPAFAAGAAWLIYAGETIRYPDQKEEVRSALAYVAKRPATKFKLSAQVTALAKVQKLPLPPNVRVPGPPDQVVFFPRSEGGDVFHWKTNDPWLTKATFGPQDVDYNWYSTWAGPDRVVIMTAEKAKATGVPFVK